MKALETELRRAVRGRDEFLSIASHELQTPLATLLLQLEGLFRAAQRTPEEPHISERALRSADMALRKARHLSEMVGTLLDVSRLQEERLTLDRRDVDLAGLVRDVTTTLEASAEQAGCPMRVRVQGEPRGWWDPLRVGQVVTNLLANAIKYAPGQPIEVTVEVVEGKARLRVVDHGPGIPVEHQPAVFERFARFMPTRNYGGFGLGLWISREIVRAHGGRISLESEGGHGATFVVDLPMAPSA
jgi:signal transduction histidine kinase